MRSDVWYLHPVDVIVPSDHVIKTVFPVHCYQGVAGFVDEKETRVAVDYRAYNSRGCLKEDAERLIQIGVDLITTDILE